MYEWLGYCQLPARLVSNLLNDHQAPPSSLSQLDFNDDDDDGDDGGDDDNDDVH